MKVFIKYHQDGEIKCETVFVKRSWFNKNGGWVEYLDGMIRRIYFVIAISPTDRQKSYDTHEWYDERALIWFKQFEKENK